MNKVKRFITNLLLSREISRLKSTLQVPRFCPQCGRKMTRLRRTDSGVYGEKTGVIENIDLSLYCTHKDHINDPPLGGQHVIFNKLIFSGIHPYLYRHIGVDEEKVALYRSLLGFEKEPT